MKIAVTSQNRRTVTEYAGRCRIFWLYQAEQGRVTGKALLRLPKEQCFHDSAPNEPHPLDEVQVLIAGSMGQGLMRRLATKGITGLVTTETDLDKAVSAYLAGSLESGSPCSHAHGEGEHQHD